jgi:Homeodomain-like domain
MSDSSNRPRSPEDTVTKGADVPNDPICPVFKTARGKMRRSQSENGLNDRQAAAIALMLEGIRDINIARTLKINRRTLYRWRALDPDFRKELARRRAELFDHAGDRLRASLQMAVNNLNCQLQHPSPVVAQTAAKTVLNLARIGDAINACNDFP